MNLQAYLQAAFTRIGTELKPLIPPPLTNFVPGWVFYPFIRVADVLGTGAVHAACSFGPQTPTIGGVAFEQSSADVVDANVPAGGWSGTNWLVEQATSAPVPPTIGTNIGRTEVTAFPDLPDPTFGQVANAATLCIASMRRNSFITISNLVVGRNYYYIAMFGTYPDSLTRATLIEPSDGGDSLTFGVDGVDSILAKGIRRYGFTAAATSISFLKSSPDASGSYQTAFAVLDQG